MVKPSTVIRFFFLFYCANESMVWIISCRWGTLSSVEIKGTVKAISRSLNSQCSNPKQFNTFSHPFAAALRKARERLLMQVCVTQDISDLLWSNFRAATSIDNIQSSQFYLWGFFYHTRNQYWVMHRVTCAPWCLLVWKPGYFTQTCLCLDIRSWNHVVGSPLSFGLDDRGDLFQPKRCYYSMIKGLHNFPTYMLLNTYCLKLLPCPLCNILSILCFNSKFYQQRFCIYVHVLHGKF